MKLTTIIFHPLKLGIKLLPILLLGQFLLTGCGTSKKTVSDRVKPPSSQNSRQVSSLSDSFFFKGIKYKMLGKYSEAAAQFDSFKTLNPSEPAGWYEAGRLYSSELRRSFKALEYGKIAYDLAAGKEKYYDIFYADLLGNNGQPKKAAQIFADLARKQPYPAEYMEREAYYYKVAKDYDKSLIILSKMEAAGFKDSNEVDMIRLQVFMDKKDKKAAHDVMENLRKRNIGNFQYTLIMASIYLNQDEDTKADKIFEGIVYDQLSEGEKELAVKFALERRTAENFNFLVNQVFVENAADSSQALNLNYVIMSSEPNLSNLVRYKNAVLQAEKAEKVSPVASYVLINFYNSLSKPDSAYYFALKGVDRFPKDDFFKLQVFDHFLRKNQPDSVICFSNRLLAVDSNQALANYGKGLAYIVKEEAPLALPYMQKAIDFGRAEFSKPFISEIFLRFGDIYHEQKLAEKSYRAYDSALFYNNNNAGALNNYAYFLSVANTRLKFAEELSEKSLVLEPESPSYLDTYGWIKYQLGDYKEAAKFIRQAIDLSDKPSAELWEHLADVELKLGSQEKAVKYWKIAIDAGGDEAILQQKIKKHDQ